MQRRQPQLIITFNVTIDASLTWDRASCAICQGCTLQQAGGAPTPPFSLQYSALMSIDGDETVSAVRWLSWVLDVLLDMPSKALSAY